MMAEFASIPGAVFWVSMIITLPALFVVLGGPVTGLLTDRLGRKPVLVGSLLLTGLAGSAGFFLDNIGIILVTRAFVGFGIAGATTATNSLIADYFEGQQRAKFMGLQSAFTGLAGVFFLPLGGFLVDIDWHYAFLSHLPLLALFPLAMIFINEPEVVSHERSFVGKLRITFTPTLIYIFAAIFLSQFTFMTVPVFIAYFMTDLLGVGGSAVGLVGAAGGVFSFFGGVIYERISRKMTYRNLTIWGFLLMGLGFLILGLASSWPFIIIGQLIVGFFVGLNTSTLTDWLASRVSAEVRGRANGIFVTMMFLGQFAMSFVFTPVVNSASYQAAYILSAVIIVFSGMAGLWVKQSSIKNNEDV